MASMRENVIRISKKETEEVKKGDGETYKGLRRLVPHNRDKKRDRKGPRMEDLVG